MLLKIKKKVAITLSRTRGCRKPGMPVPSSPTKGQKHLSSLHLFIPLTDESGGGREGTEGTRSESGGGEGRSAQRSAERTGPFLSQRITHEDPGDMWRVRQIEPPH